MAPITESEHYINNQTGLSYKLLSFGKLKSGEELLDCAIFHEAYGNNNMVEEYKTFIETHTLIPDLTNKKVKCISPISGWKYEVCQWYNIVPGMGVYNELPVVHTKFGQGVHIYMPSILKHFDLLNSAK